MPKTIEQIDGEDHKLIEKKKNESLNWIKAPYEI